MADDEFTPRLGKPRARGSKSAKRYAHQVLAAVNRAGGRSARKSGAGLGRIGRGGAPAAALAGRGRSSSRSARRVIVKARIVRLAGKGMDTARAHLRYIQRDGVTRDGERGSLYGADRDREDGRAFLDRADGDRHQFRFIVAPEDGAEYDDLRPLTRRLMAQMETDLGTRLDWVAVDHFNTGHPHSHILLRGKDERGHDLVIARDYMAHGLRERAADLVSLDLGPRTELEIAQRDRADIEAERLVPLDRQLRSMADDDDGVVSPAVRDPTRQTLLAGRLRKLERLGLAEEARPGRWRLDPGFEQTLSRMGERGDIIKTLNRELTERGRAPDPGETVVHDHGTAATRVVGRVVARGLSDEIRDRQSLIVDGLDGRMHYVDIGPGDGTEPTPEGAIVAVAPRTVGPRDVDRTVVAVAEAHGGRYSVDRHLAHDPSATEAFAETHVRRLEAIRRATGAVEREPDGTWVIGPDHLDRVADYEQTRARAAPMVVRVLSPLSLDRQVETDGATWLDRDLTSESPEATREAGFGREVQAARLRRTRWLIEQGLARDEAAGVRFQQTLLATLRRREMTRAAGALSEELGLPYAEARPGERVEGTYRRAVDLASGRMAVIEKAREFTLVPWRPVLDRHVGRSVSGVLRGDTISWTIGRQRSGPSIS
jgi:type IV secretory pathway VirD2 relaxase